MTKNPHDSSRVSGGSSGGECALIASGGSLLGFGNDLGGSIRQPSGLCGVCGLKPTGGRISLKGLNLLLPGQTCVADCYGPMARDVDTLVLGMKALLSDDMFDLDPTLPPLHFDTQIYDSRKPLCIGYFSDNGLVPADPANQRAVNIAKAVLEKQGHKLVAWCPPRIDYGVGLWVAAILGDGGRTMWSYLKGDTVAAHVWQIVPSLIIPVWIKQLLAPVVALFSKNLAEKVKASCGFRSVYLWWQHVLKVEKYKDEFVSDWRKHGLDAVISPVCPHQAPFIANLQDFDIQDAAEGYYMLYNLLNCPAGVVPVTKVTKDDINNASDYPTPGSVHKAVVKLLHGSEGMPVTVQCAALPWQDELCLRVMKELENGANYQK